MRKIGITGTIASGKTSVSILLKKHGFAVFNCDQYAKMATHAGNPCFDRLVSVLGKDVLDDGGDIDRQKMASLIFQDENKRLCVNEIVHPYVIEGMRHMMGSTVPNDAQVGTIRADFSQTKEFNTIHGSDSPASAEREIAIYFKPEEFCENWKTMMEYVWESMPSGN